MDPAETAKNTFKVLYGENTIYKLQTAASRWQWFVRTSKISGEVRQLLRQGNITFYPPNWQRLFEDWLSQTGDLPICQSSLSIDPPQTFSSWFTTASLLARHTPISLLVADHNTFFLHLAPMLVLAVYLNQRNPVRDIVVFGRVKKNKNEEKQRDHDYYPDTIRFGIASQASPGRSPLLSHIPMESYQALSNKIQQAYNYVKRYLPGDGDITLDHQQMVPADRWLLHLLNTTAQQVTDFLEKYRIDRAARHLQYFFHNQYCNWYLEFCRGNLNNQQTRRVLRYSLIQILAMFQPFLPDLCRRIFNQLDITDHPLPFPSFESRFVFTHSFKAVELLKRLISSTRKIRGIYHIPPTKRFGIYLRTESQEEKQMVESSMETIRRLHFLNRRS